MRRRLRPLISNFIESRSLMQNAIRRCLLLASLVVAVGPAAALAQSGSSGGSIGNDDKSLSGSREAPSVESERSARRSKPEAEEPRRTDRKSGGGGTGNFDGPWIAVGVGTNCQGSAAVAWVISGGRVIGQGVSGGVSPSGAYRATSVGSDGIVLTATGRLSGNRGSGTYIRSDGCAGRWTASKQ
jgi:hypothetical protein